MGTNTYHTVQLVDGDHTVLDQQGGLLAVACGVTSIHMGVKRENRCRVDMLARNTVELLTALAAEA